MINCSYQTMMRRLLLGGVLLTSATMLAACGGGDKNVRDDGMDQTSKVGDKNARAGDEDAKSSHRRDIDVRGLEGIPEGDREKFVDPDNPLSTRTLYFDFDNDNIKSKYNEAVKAHAKYLSEHENVTIRLEGNTDERGTREYNVALGERRAEAVKKALTMSGASSSQVKTISYGQERPAEMGHSEEAYAKNRRVDFIYPKQ